MDKKFDSYDVKEGSHCGDTGSDNWYNSFHHNGKHGDNVSNIEGLFIALREEVLSESFFSTYSDYVNISDTECTKMKLFNFCPIESCYNHHRFFGNFENLSYNFNIYTKDEKLIKRLSNAIKNNEGWKKYYEKNLVKGPQDESI